MKRHLEQQQGNFGIAARARVVRVGVLVSVCAGLVACSMGTDSGEGLKELQAGQKAILERMEKIETGQKQLLASLQKKPSPKRPSIDYNKVYDIKIGKSPVRGAKDAKVTLVEFSDFQCPYSKRVQPLVKDLLAAFPDDLQHVYKNMPLSFHKQAMPAAKACLAAGMQGKFWEMHDLIFNNSTKLSEEDLKNYAGQIGLDMQKFEKDFKGDEVEKRVQADLAAARQAEVGGTPTLFLNGKRVQNRSEEAMKKQIKGLSEAKKKS